MQRTHARHIVAGLAVLSVTLLSACGSSSGSTTASSVDLYGKTVTFDQALHDALPQAMKDKGTVVVSTDAAGPPRSFIDSDGAIVGVMPDLMKAVATKLGIKLDIQKNSFDAETPGVESGRFDSTSGTGDFPKRRAVLDLVDYMKAGYLYLVATGNPKKVADDFPSQCGLRVGVLKGTTQETLVTDLSKKCVAAGKPAIDLQSFTNVLLEVPLAADRVDVVWENTSTGYQVSSEQPDKFAIAGSPVWAAYLAFGMKKDNSAYRDALQKTLQGFLDDGTYQAILDHWKQGDLAMDKISTNSDVRS